MLNWMLLLALSTLGLLIYLWLAPKLNLVDKPNNRSSHNVPTVVGAGAVASIGKTIGSVAAFAVGRWLLAGYLRRRRDARKAFPPRQT